MDSFFIKSVEHRTYTQKHKCVVNKRVDINKLLVEIEPPIPSYVYNSDQDIDLMVLAPRYEDAQLVPSVSEWPCRVNMCLNKEGGNLEKGPWRLIDIGEITCADKLE